MISIGRIIPETFELYVDEVTGARVERLTDPECLCHHTYPLARVTTSDGKFMLTARQINGRRQLFCMNLETAASIQITSGNGVDDYQAAFTPDNRHVLYIQEGVIWLFDVRDFLRIEAYRAPSGWEVREFSLCEDGCRLAVVEMRSSSVEPSTYDEDWSKYDLYALAQPRSRIVLKNLESGWSTAVLEERQWLARPLFCPTDPDLLMYLHEGAQDLIDARMWFIRVDGTEKRCARPQNHDVLTASFWFPDGKRIGYLCREDGDAGRTTVRVLDAETLEETILMEVPPFAHCKCGPSGRFLVGDAQSFEREAHLVNERELQRLRGKRADNDYIYLVDLEQEHVAQLCYHGSSWLSDYGVAQDAMPHPVFSLDGRYVVFVSDREGSPCIYRMDVARFVWEWEMRTDEAYECGIASTFSTRLYGGTAKA